MIKQNDSNLDFIILGIKIFADNCESSLQRLTKFLDLNFAGLDAKKLPEYQEAIDAIRNYKEALFNLFDKKYNDLFKE